MMCGAPCRPHTLTGQPFIIFPSRQIYGPAGCCLRRRIARVIDSQLKAVITALCSGFQLQPDTRGLGTLNGLPADRKTLCGRVRAASQPPTAGFDPGPEVPSSRNSKPPFRAPGNPEPERSSTPHPGSARLRLQSQTPAGRAACQCLVRRGEAKDAALCLQSPTPGSLGQLTLPTFPGLCFHLWN
ncbi:hypothetical protein CB1_000589027 [Camelus ferus]|nr:hypothetical protein CB1_000589027 [Camelus ferus]